MALQTTPAISRLLPVIAGNFQLETVIWMKEKVEEKKTKQNKTWKSTVEFDSNVTKHCATAAAPVFPVLMVLYVGSHMNNVRNKTDKFDKK